jgi:CRP-like cAMP-binding protein
VHEVQDVEIEASLPALAPLNEESFEIIGEPSAQELLLPQVGLLSSLSQAAFVDLANAMRHREARAGDTLFALGDPGDSLLLLSRGKVSAFRPGLTSNAFLEELVPGDFLGLLSAISPRGRAATVIAQTDIEFFEIPMFEIERLIKTHPAVEKTFYRFVRHRLLMSVLSQLPVVHELPSESREAIARRFKQRPFTAGEELVYEGAEVNTMFLILKGRMAIGPEATSGDIEDPITVVEPGDLVGCIAAQAGTTADTCIQALEDGVCAVITHKVFEDLATVYTPLQRMAAGLDDERYLVSNTVFTLSIGLRADRINIIDD